MSRPSIAVGPEKLPRNTPAAAAPVDSTEWWRKGDDELHASLMAAVDSCQKAQGERRARLEHHWRLYKNTPLAGLSAVVSRGSTRMSGPGGPLNPARFSVNVVRSCVDTAVAKIAKSRPKPKFLTMDGDGQLQRKARWLNQYVLGVFEDSGLHREAQGAFRDGCLFDFGCVRLAWEDDADGDPRLIAERVFPWEILIDDEDAHYGRPKQLRHERWMYPDQLAALFPKHAARIRELSSPGRRTYSTNPVVWGRGAGMIRVVEAWKLPSRRSAKDGKRAIAIDGLTLHSERYEADYFPFLFFRWTDDVVGYGGGSLAEILSPLQAIINRQTRDIEAAQRLSACPRIIVDGASNVNYASLRARRDEIPVIKVQAGTRPPTFMTANAMPAEMYQSLERNIARAYELTGISQLTAQAQKPGGLDSGAAIREYSDAASERFGLVSQRWDDLFVAAARLIVDMTRRKHASRQGGGRIKVRGSDGDFLRQLSWKDVAIDEDKFSIGCFPTPALLGSPAAQTQTVIEWLQAGLIPRKHALSLLQFPDVEAFTSTETAALRDVQREIERILDDGEPGEVDDMTDLGLCVELGQSAVLRAKRTHEPERVELLRRWVDECRQRMKELEAEAAPPPAPGGGGGMGDLMKQLGPMLQGMAGGGGAPGGGGNPLAGVLPGLEKGGPAKAGQPYVMGEKGPEVFVPTGAMPLYEPEGQYLQQDAGGRGYLATLDDSGGGPSLVNGPQIPGFAPRRQVSPADVARQAPATVPRQRPMTPEEMMAEADRQMALMRAEHEARMAEGPAVSVDKLEAREKGGPVTRGKPYVVGEAGPEVVVPGQDGVVVPAHVAPNVAGLRPVTLPSGEVVTEAEAWQRHMAERAGQSLANVVPKEWVNKAQSGIAQAQHWAQGQGQGGLNDQAALAQRLVPQGVQDFVHRKVEEGKAMADRTNSANSIDLGDIDVGSQVKRPQGKKQPTAEELAKDEEEARKFMAGGKETVKFDTSPEAQAEAKRKADEDNRKGAQLQEDAIRKANVDEYEAWRKANPKTAAFADWQKRRSMSMEKSTKELLGEEGKRKLDQAYDQGAPTIRRDERYMDGVHRIREPVSIERDGRELVRQPVSFERDRFPATRSPVDFQRGDMPPAFPPPPPPGFPSPPPPTGPVSAEEAELARKMLDDLKRGKK